MFSIMEENGFLRPSRLLTGKESRFLFETTFNLPWSIGYIPGAEGLSAVAELSEKLCKKNPNLLYLLDRKHETLCIPIYAHPTLR